MSNFTEYFIGTIGLSVGGLLGYFCRIIISNRLSLERLSISEFNKAASDFRAGFAPAIAQFPLLSDVNNIDAMLRRELVPQAIAIERFRPFICSSKRDAYQEAWEEYHQSHKRDGVSSVYFLDYAMGDEKERFALFNKNTNKVLEFAEK